VGWGEMWVSNVLNTMVSRLVRHKLTQKLPIFFEKICALSCQNISQSKIASLFSIMANDIFSEKKITAEHS
jgi:hypothetical protein